MRSILLSVALAFVATSTPAQIAPADRLEVCQGMHSLASAVMGARQRGVSMGEALSTVHALEGPGPVRTIAEQIVAAAYAEPDWNSESVEQDAIVDFANSVEIACLSD